MRKKTKILIVDDEDIVRESLSDWLDGVGYDVEVAESGEAALRIIRQKKLKIMVADLVMPGMDGIELMKEAKKIMLDISYWLSLVPSEIFRNSFKLLKT